MSRRKGKAKLETPRVTIRSRSSNRKIPKLSSLDGIWAIDYMIRELNFIRDFVLHQHGQVLPAERLNTVHFICHMAHGSLDGVMEMPEQSRDVKGTRATQAPAEAVS